MLLLLALALILLNGFFVAAEFALVKVRATQLDTLVAQGKANAVTARAIVRKLDAYLSATQLGITLASLGLGWVGEPAVAVLFEGVFAALDITDPATIHTVSFVLAFTVISFLHIVVGEIAPKSLAIIYPVQTSLVIAWPMRLFYYPFYPFLVVLNWASNRLLRAMGVAQVGDSHGMAYTTEELVHITAASTAEGIISRNEGQLLTNVLTFSDHVAREIMVPRNRVVWLTNTATLDQALAVAIESGFTRLPVAEATLDNVLGILNTRDLFTRLLEGRTDVPLTRLIRPVFYVPENMPAQRLLLEFQKQHSHLAVVVDEYGGLSGIVTLEDALEELVGEIQDEYDQERQPILATPEGYSVDAALLLEDLCRVLGLPPVPSDADTVGGYVFEQLNRVAAEGDSVTLTATWGVRVTEMEKMRIARVAVYRQTQPAAVEAS